MPRELEVAVPFLDRLALEHDDRVVGFSLAVLDFRAPSRNQTAYTLEGFDDGYIEAGTRGYATYTNLPGGTYQLRLRAAGHDGVWHDVERTLTVVVAPPCWQTWSFRITTLVLLVGSVAGGHRLRTQALHRRAEALAELNLRLEDEVAERGRAEAEIKRLYESLEQSQAALIQTEKMSALGTLSAGVAHELNNPLMGLVNYVDYCLRHTDAGDRRHGVLEDARDEINRCMEIVTGLLTFSRTAPAVESPRGEVAVAIDRVLALLTYRLRKLDIEAELHIPDELPSCAMATSELQQVLLNLVTNACDALEDVPATHRRLVIRVEHDDSRLELQVEDSGPGLPANLLTRLFDPFVTTKPEGKGTGLGLSIARGLVESRGGSLDVDQASTQGTTFLVTIPCAH